MTQNSAAPILRYGSGPHPYVSREDYFLSVRDMVSRICVSAMMFFIL